MDIELKRNDLDKSIELLSSAAQALHLTRLQSLSYHALMLSVDVAMLTFALTVGMAATSDDALFAAVETATGSIFEDLALSIRYGISLWPYGWVGGVAFIFVVVFLVSILFGLVSLMLNIPLFARVFRERARLKKLGLSSLSRSLWTESRRSRWISRARSYLLIGVGIFLVAVGALLSIAGTASPGDRTGLFLGALSFALIAVLLFAARNLRNQRERIDLAANAEELRNALQSLRQRAGDVDIFTVPSVLLEQTAKIEAAQIAKERKDAVLKSIASPSREYAVAFDRGAVEQRATLSIAERIRA